MFLSDFPVVLFTHNLFTEVLYCEISSGQDGQSAVWQKGRMAQS